jgi:putative FmdB family regulatory protein
MPIFEYLCQDCRRPFEKLILKREEAIACPACGSNRYTLQFSVTAAPAKGDNAASSCACTPTTCGCN